MQSACIVKDIRFFVNPAFLNHKASVNKYRTRFEEDEVKYLYWDIELINLFYKKQNSSITFRLRCIALTTGKEMYSQEQTVNFLSYEISRTANYSSGHRNQPLLESRSVFMGFVGEWQYGTFPNHHH